MFFGITNHVRVAVDRVGGVTKASNLIGIANNTIHTWIKNRRIPNIDHATKLAKLSGIDVQQLRGTL
ncbi:hypothetical protein TK49_13055 [Ralstonia mannitolilytica]|uniref:helix-turn-helix domain-containing protein n=1 Tax=Ralstonia mannitolilytica TaxID=105219 RepID=UPI0005D90E8C|nr:helix-turn-helix transcriptional regulator [Ralstonia mannitolilytica]AJW45545.1 hypothetical protein TK49_13055 [Ralstonia mannitolilytica]